MQPEEDRERSGRASGSEATARAPYIMTSKQPALRRPLAGDLQVVGERRILEPRQPPPAVRGADELSGDIAREPVARHTLEGCRERLDGSPRRDRDAGERDPSPERQEWGEPSGLTGEADVERRPVKDCLQSTVGWQGGLDSDEEQDAQDELRPARQVRRTASRLKRRLSLSLGAERPGRVLVVQERLPSSACGRCLSPGVVEAPRPDGDADRIIPYSAANRTDPLADVPRYRMQWHRVAGPAGMRRVDTCHLPNSTRSPPRRLAGPRPCPERRSSSCRASRSPMICASRCKGTPSAIP